MVARGEVWWADFGEPFGSEPGYERPVLVVSSDRYNRSRIGTVIVTSAGCTLDDVLTIAKIVGLFI